MKRLLATVLITLLVVAAAVIVIPYTGAIDVAATRPHPPGVHWFLETTQQRSVARRAAAIRPPDDLSAPRRVARGLTAYHQMCVTCHGAPGVEASEIGKGLNPKPPELWRQEEREIASADAARDFWVLRQGINMTGMPAFGPTHGDRELWDVVAFLQQLPAMSAESYATAVGEAGLELHAGGHGHGGEAHGAESPDAAAAAPREASEDHHHEPGEEHRH
ncbi:MAG TPA: cytochrome c [Thermoanaerobaculia bacterium]|nr:cytochrome c [Thermoanaerobaculia bacterium]